MVLATVSWADGHISEVNLVNLERQPGNPAPEAWLPAEAKRISGISCFGLQLRPLAHRAAWQEASKPADAVVSAGVCGAQLMIF